MVSSKHIPVMLNEVLQALQPQDGATYVDATFGNGGYTEAILKSADCRVIAIDRDPFVIKRAEELKSLYGNRFDFVSGTFSQIDTLIPAPVNGVVFDIGVSSMQLDNSERGFSFSKEAPLDMRMSQAGLSAKDIINSMNEQDLADLIYKYGEERKSRQIAHAITLYRAQKAIETTTELAQIIYSVLPRKREQIDPATRTFQAIRIAVNDELHQLQDGLEGALRITLPKGRIVVVDFHSLEDRMVKHRFRKWKEEGEGEPNPRKPLLPTEEETELNHKSRSAKMRIFQKYEEETEEEEGSCDAPERA